MFWIDLAEWIHNIIVIDDVIFSALAELEPGNVVSVCPSTVFPGNRSKDFAETWSEVKGG